MSEQPDQTAPSAAPTGQPGPLSRLVERFEGAGKHAEADVARVVGGAASLVTDHASTIYDLVGDILAAAKLVDPADAPLADAFQALVPKAIAAAGKVSDLASAALKSS